MHLLRLHGSRSQAFSEGISMKIKRKAKTSGINYKSNFLVWRVAVEILDVELDASSGDGVRTPQIQWTSCSNVPGDGMDTSATHGHCLE